MKQSKKREKIRNYIFGKLILTKCLLLYPICNIQFNSWKTHFRVAGIRVIIAKTGFAVILAKIFIIIIVVKQVTYNSKVSDVTIFLIF